jgi:predicted Zn-dependent protease
MAFRIRNIILLFYLMNSLIVIAQNDSLAQIFIAKKNMRELQEEQKDLNFQKYFFDALQQRAIGNYDKAIDALENCQNIYDNAAVNFEFAKNYFDLEQLFEAENYMQKASKKDPDNLYMLLLLKNIYNNQSKFEEALEVQKKIVLKKPDLQFDLVILYIKNKKIDEAKKLLLDLEKKGLLSENLIPFKESLINGSVSVPTPNEKSKPVEKQTLEELKATYNLNKSFAVLRVILSQLNSDKNFTELKNLSEQSIELFPAQPFVYLLYATALNQTKDYEKALEILQNGVDYIVDDPLLKADFFEQMSLSYKGLSENIKATDYYNKAIVLRQNKTKNVKKI